MGYTADINSIVKLSPDSAKDAIIVFNTLYCSSRCLNSKKLNGKF